MEKTDLKRCPFCGGEASLRDEPDKYYKFTVYCTKCGIGTLAEHIESIAIHAWNRRVDESRNSEQKEPDFYICTESFLLANIGDEGELLETQSEILKGSMWSKGKSEYRFCNTSDSVRLENSERWIEISSDRFSKYFTPVWRNK